ncbi:MAG: hypothetical protein CMQ15_04485 [Gammaproteobacteria bacterium]|jgi:hypothetical protein|nr:hypothetical protein [Gammaproteobacteria bacterium]MBT71287.1 hypothetical protein [Gammaproteobacteria bacterium]HJN95981.1 hypothetical protein [Gammaproteobacteria bacterium]|tara:strand:+ start:12796 stop:13791 length:996 start_codon:yes stop_codon:yes gene_type:complete
MTFLMTNLRKILLLSLAVFLVNIGFVQLAQAQAALSYFKGQHVEPGYEGWRRNDDGSVTFYFGYHNENWEEELDIPISDNNFFSPGERDRDQPTHFLPRRNRFTFEVDMPVGWDETQDFSWTLISPNGEVRRAYGSMNTDYIINPMIIASETGSLGAGISSPESRANVAPVVSVLGDSRRNARVGEPITLRAHVEDDGLPRPRRTSERQIAADTEAGGVDELDQAAIKRARLLRRPGQATVGKTNGLYLSWSVYRGRNVATFDPPQSKVWEDTRASGNSPWGVHWVPPPIPEDGNYETEVTFDEPGEYTLWARADDGGLYHDTYITVTVSR